MEKKRRNLDIMLGLFVAAGVVLLISLVYILGKERRLFDTSAYLNARYPNVAGLAVGAEVMLAGVVIGHVSEIKFPQFSTKKEGGSSHKEVTVVMRISSNTLPWIREDSVAVVDSKGLLGDRTINIGLGSFDSPQVQSGDFLLSEPPLDFNKALGKAQAVLDNITDTVVGAKQFLQSFIDEGGDEALAKAAESVRQVTKEIAGGKGLIHELVYNEQSTKDFKEALSNLKGALKNIEKSASGIESLVADIKRGPNVSEFVENMISASADVKSVMADVRAGKGTAGRVFNDPTVYDDLKIILGNVKRNSILKALVRFAISQEEKNSAPGKEK